MSKLNINKSEWLELVFEGKNKAYGAYELRQEDGKTTMKAFFGALLLIVGLSSGAMIFSSFGEKPIVDITKDPGGLIVTDVFLQPKEEIKKEESIKKGKAIKEVKSRDLIDPIIVEKSKAPETPITENSKLGLNKDPDVTEEGDGKGDKNGKENVVIVKPIDKPIIIDEGIHTSNSVEVNPAFPGGIDKFLKEVGKRFVAPEMEEEKTIRVIVLFVIEKDGSLSNIKVANDPGYGMGAEAIRVLKAIKTKWEPGYMGNMPVRTSFSLPILVKTTGS
jgi:periplasmic protein TonB